MATTRVYNSYAEFRNRADKKENGVSEDVFASRYGGDMERLLADSGDNRGCWDCFECEGCHRTIGRSFRREERAA